MGIPALGLGTYRFKDDAVIASVSIALKLGYRAIDTAQIYDNEAAIGKALQSSQITHEELFITTEIWKDNFSKEKLIFSLRERLVSPETLAPDWD